MTSFVIQTKIGDLFFNRHKKNENIYLTQSTGFKPAYCCWSRAELSK